MPLSVNNTIVANDIYHLRMFKDLKVWLLEGGDNDKVVIKTDAVHQGQYKSASPIVKAIAPNAAVKVLSVAERNALKEFIDMYEHLSREYELLGMSYHADEKPAVDSLKQSLTFGFPFVKMEAKNVRDLEGALVQRLAGNKNDLNAFITALTAAGGLEKLGKIIAADMFNGNTDRFFPGSNSTKVIGGMTFNLRCLVNVGNVFVVMNQAGAETGAMDFLDPNSQFKDMNTPLNELEDANTKWPARLLVQKRTRDAFADDCIHDLEAVLDPKKSKFRLTTKLGRNASSRLSTGMVEGAKLIKGKLELKYNPNRWTPGIRERYLIIAQVR